MNNTMKTDSEIQKHVMDELSWLPFLNAHEIGVAVKDGIVTLSGTVDTYSKKVAAEAATQKIEGVKAIAEEIQVRLGHEDNKTDAEIASAVINALKWNNAMKKSEIKVEVEKGWVTLSGNVEWDFQRNSAVHTVQDLTGVAGIFNNIVVRSSVQPKDVENNIMAAFHRSAAIDAKKLNIEVNGSAVTLSGKVRSYAEKRDAEKAVWFVPGINRVDNKIEIDSETPPY